MTLAHSGTVPSVLQSPVEALIWPSSSPLNQRGEEKEEEEVEGVRAERKRKKWEIKEDQQSRQCVVDRKVKGDRGD